MDKRIEMIQNQLSGNSDFIIRKIEVNLGRVYLLFLNTICDNNFISDSIIKSIIENKDDIKDTEQIKDKIITHTDINYIYSLDEALTYILTGNTIIMFSFSKDILYCSTRKIEERSIEIPPSETVIKGPRKDLQKVLKLIFLLLEEGL